MRNHTKHWFAGVLIAPVLFGLAGNLSEAQEKSNSPEKGKANVEVTITGVKNRKGTLRINLYNKSDGFPADMGKALIRRDIVLKDLDPKAKLDPQVVTFENLAPGTYAVCSIHDGNSNGKLDKDWLGRPSEAIGVSNNIRPTFRAPHFDEAQFKVAADEKKTLKIEIKR